MKRNLFAYGTLMCEDILTRVAGSTPAAAASVLTDFRRLVIRDAQYPGLIRYPGGRVEGVLYRDIAAAAWLRLDSFEGEMYERIAVTVEAGDGTLVEADTYLIRPGFEQLLELVEWDFETFLANGKEAFIREYTGYAVVSGQAN